MLPFHNEAFNVVLSQGALSEIIHPEKTVLEMSRVLKTGGKLVIIAYGKRGFINIVNPWALKPNNLEKLLTKEGFYIEKLAWLKSHYILVVGIKYKNIEKVPANSPYPQ